MPRKKIFLIICGAVVLAGLAYYFFFMTGDSSTVSSTEGGQASQAEVSFLSLFGKLDPISFDISVLTDPRFMALTDIRTTIVPEPVGRKDVFAPIGH